MDTSKRKKMTYVMVAGAMCLAAWAASAMPRLARPKTIPTTDTPTQIEKPVVTTTVPKAPPRVEVVFALDTTGSMSGLIDGAKRKIWSLAQYIANGQPRPELRIGLVAYRDVGDAYVTRFYDLTDDLDKVFERLSSFEAAGGGDTPEHVAKALFDAVNRTSWSGDQGTLKQIYLVGDAPPHADYQDGFDYRAIAKKANSLGIHINTIRCGHDRSTQLAWNEISRIASGEYASIDQGGGVVAIATPYDTKLQELNSRLVGTAMGYGAHEGEVRAKKEAAMKLDGSSAADRAGFFGLGGKGAVSGRGDITTDALSGLIDVKTAPPAALPEPMRAMDPAAREAFVQKNKADRDKINAEIVELSKKRSTYINERKPKDSFDSRVEEAVKSQAASVGLKY